MKRESIHAIRWRAIKDYVTRGSIDARKGFTRRQQITIKKLYEELSPFLHKPDLFTTLKTNNPTVKNLSLSKSKRLKKWIIYNPSQDEIEYTDDGIIIGHEEMIFIPYQLDEMNHEHENRITELLEPYEEKGRLFRIALASNDGYSVVNNSFRKVHRLITKLYEYENTINYKEEDNNRVLSMIRGFTASKAVKQGTVKEYLNGEG